MQTYRIEFLSFEDLIRDFLALSSFLGRTPAIVVYRYKNVLHMMHPFYEGIGIHYYKDEEEKFPAGTYIFDVLTEKIKPRGEKKELSTNEVLVIILEIKKSSLFEDAGGGI